MPAEVLTAGRKVVSIFSRTAADGNVAGAGTVTSGKHRAVGMGRIKGSFYSAQAPAAGYPRVRFSPTGEDWRETQEVQRDASQSGFLFRFDFALRGPYVLVEWQHGGTPAAVEASAYLEGGGEGLGDALGASLVNGSQVLTTDKETQFEDASAALEQGAQVDLTGLVTAKGIVRQVVLLTEQQEDWELHFWSRDTADDVDSDDDAWLGRAQLLAAGSSVIANDASGGTVFRYAAQLELAYVDEDNSGEFHMTLVCTSAAKLAAGAGGNVTARIVFEPERA